MKGNENVVGIITGMNILNLMIGNAKDILCLSETTGVAFTVANVQLKFIIEDMQRRTLGKNQLGGLFQYANIVMTLNIDSQDKNYALSSLG